MGYMDAVDDIVHGNTDSDSFKLVMDQAGSELEMLIARKDLTMNQASTLLHVMLRAQHRLSPEQVGPPYGIVWLCKGGGVNWIKRSD